MSHPNSEAPRLLISPADESDLPAVRRLFTQYAESLPIDLTFQSFAEELASLPGKYAPPSGQILMAKRISPSKSELHNDITAGDIEPGISRDGSEDNELVDALGCVALRPISFATPFDRNKDNIKACEMKRLYALPSARGQGVGKALITEILKVAKELGYHEMYLDTLASMTTALGMYEAWGFERIDPYYHNPNDGTVFLVKRL